MSTFSVDEVYNNNELKRPMGLMKEGKTVRSIAPGRHQLSSQLNSEFAQNFNGVYFLTLYVIAVQWPRGVLEQSLSHGTRNKKKACSKYES